MTGSLSILQYELYLARLAAHEANTVELREFWSNRAKLAERELEALFEKKGQGGSMSIKAIIGAARRELDLWHEYGKGMSYSEFKRSPRRTEAYENDRDLRRFVDALPGPERRVKTFGELQDGRPRNKTLGQLLTAQDNRDDEGALLAEAEEVVRLRWEPPSDPAFYAGLDRCLSRGKCELEDRRLNGPRQGVSTSRNGAAHVAFERIKTLGPCDV